MRLFFKSKLCILLVVTFSLSVCTSIEGGGIDYPYPLTWAESLGKLNSISITTVGIWRSKGDSNKEGHEEKTQIYYLGSRFLLESSSSPKGFGKKLNFVSAFDGEQSYWIHGAMNKMVIDKGHSGELEVHPSFVNPMSIALAAIYQPRQCKIPEKFGPNLPQIKEWFSEGQMIKPKKITTIDSKFGPCLQLEWDVEGVKHESEICDLIPHVKLAKVLIASGMPIYAIFGNKGDEKQWAEWEVTEAKLVPESSENMILFPVKYKYRMGKGNLNENLILTFLGEVIDFQVGGVIDESIFRVDPRRYGINKIVDHETDETYELP